MVTAALQRARIKPKPIKPLLTRKSTVKSKPFNGLVPTKVKKETKVVTPKTFDMTCAGHILYYPDFEGLPIRKGSKMTPEIMKNTLDGAKVKGGWVSWYTGEPWFDAHNNRYYCDYTHCHAGIKSPPFPNTFLLDVINWGVVGKASKEMTDKMHKMLISKDSPWADALENVYFILNKEDNRLLAMYVVDMEKDISEGLRRLFVNFLIAIRALSEHRDNRNALAGAQPTNTLLGWFAYISLRLSIWHNWHTGQVLGKKWLTTLFQKKHSMDAYKHEPNGAKKFTNMCNSVYPCQTGDTELTLEAVNEVEKELGYGK